MSKKFIQNIQKLIEEKDPKKDLGLVSEGNISHFQAKPPALVSTSFTDDPIPDPSEEIPTPIPKSKNFTWNKESFNHNRGAFKDLIFEDFITTIKKSKTTINSINGDLSDYIVGDNKNVKYTVQVNVSTPITVTITPYVNNSISLAVYTAPGFSTASKIFTSGSQRYSPSNINLNFNKVGLWTITILLYQEKGDTAFNILDRLGSFVESANETIIVNTEKLITFDTTRGNNGIESIFVDGAFGSSLSNVIYWNRLDNFTEEFGGGELAGYGLYTVVNERISNDVVSGWGTDAFVVSGSKLPIFPIAATLGISGPASTAYKVSGTEFDTGANRTIVTVSGTAFSGAKFDPIYIERTIHLTDILQDDTLGSVVSGTHFNVKTGDQYTYEVDTFNSFGNRGPRSTRISGTAGDINPPGLVTSLAGTGSLKAIRLTWTNPTNIDLKGIHVFDTPTVISGTTKPIATIIKGSNTTIPEEVVVAEVSSGTLIDQWPYDLYVATFDHAGNSSTENMPTVSVTTDVDVRTSQEGQRIEFSTSLNNLRFYDDNDLLLVTIGDNINGIVGGLGLTNVSAILNTISNPTVDPINVGMTLNDSTGLDSRGAITAEVIFSQSQLTNNKTAGIFGTITDQFHTATSDYIAVRGRNTGTENEHIFSGYFDGAKVFIEKDLIVSGNMQLATTSQIRIPRADDTIIGRITTASSGDRLDINADTGGVRFRTGGNATIMTVKDSGVIELGQSTLDSLQITPGTTIPTRRGIGLPRDPDGQMRFYVHSFQGSAKFEFFDGNIEARRFAIESNLISGSGRVIFDDDVSIGTTLQPSANGGKVLTFGDNTADPTMDTNTAGIYAKDVSGTVEMFAVNEADVASQLTSHNNNGEWIHFCINKKTGKVEYVNMKKAFKVLEKLSGEKLYHEIDIDKFKDPDNISSLDAEKLIDSVAR